jgi:Fic family protein
MQTFATIDRQLGLVPARLVRTLGAIDLGRGRELAYAHQHPQALETLTDVARIQSTEASNAIERIHAPHARIEALVRETTEPANRSEAEIAGYRWVLDLIHQSSADMPFTPSVVLQLHRDLFRFTTTPAGRWKAVDNTITETGPGDTVRVRFETVAAAATPDAMRRLHDAYAEAVARGEHHRLLLVGAYVLDFLSIHPFLDGNGRIGRLLTLLALYQAGYGVGRYISLEQLIDRSRESYYDALQASSVGWHDGRHDVLPWLEYLLGTVKAAYDDLEERVGHVGGRGAKSDAIRSFATGGITSFAIADVRKAVPSASDSLISKVLVELRDEASIERIGRGRGTRWQALERTSDGSS